jgi:hypothetical protein
MGNTESILEAVAVANINKNGIEDEAPAGVPETMAGCLSSDDGKEVFSSYEKYCQEQDRKEAWMAREDHRLRLKLIHSLMEEEEMEDSVAPTKKKQKRAEKGVCFYMDEDGVQQVVPPEMSLWYNLYACPEARAEDHDQRFLKKFRRRFRCPYPLYLELCDLAINDPYYFRRWKPGTTDAVGRESAPIHLMILTSLRYLGRGWTFDDCEEATAVSEDVCRVFFHEFISFGKNVLYPKYVVAPNTREDAAACSAEFAQAGLPGAIGSMDATHVCHERIQFRLRQLHLAQKLHTSARSYNIVTNHQRRILSTTTGHPATWNDKTLVTFDEWVMGIRTGKYLSDLEFDLYEEQADGTVIKRKYRGAWLLVDNGYHHWAITILPYKQSEFRNEIHFLEWLESMRKDVECTFGILKGRWRILKAGIRVHGLEAGDNIWLTCCALHNMLLDHDGLDERWQAGVPSDWQGELGQHEQRDLNRLPPAITRLHNPALSRNYDSSAMGHGEDFYDERRARQLHYEPQDRVSQVIAQLDGAVMVRSLTMEQFCKRLVKHFNIAFAHREIVWPSRTGVPAPITE